MRNFSSHGTLFIAGSVFFGIFLFLNFTFFDSKNNQANLRATREILPTGVNATLLVREPDLLSIEEYIVREGDTWSTIAEFTGIERKLSDVLLQESQASYNLASIRTGNVFRFYFQEPSKDFVKLEYDISDEELLIIEKNGDVEFSGRKEKIAYQIETVVKSGNIENSLFETALLRGIPAKVILNMATIFGWDIDFASGVQKGDSFSMVYEDRFRDGKYVGPGVILAARFINSGEHFYAFRYNDTEGVARYYDREGRELRRQFLRSPLDYTRITSGFSYNRFHPILNTFTNHRAIDYAAAAGTPVSVTADGTVSFAGVNDGNGKFISVQHANGYSTGYAHLSAYAKGIKRGAKVRQNEVIGFVGSTGLSTGPHLHYEMRKDGVLINPLSLNLPPGKLLEGEDLSKFFHERDRLATLLQNT